MTTISGYVCTCGRTVPVGEGIRIWPCFSLGSPHCAGVLSEHVIERYEVQERPPKGQMSPALHNPDLDRKKPRRKDTPALHVSPFAAGKELVQALCGAGTGTGWEPYHLEVPGAWPLSWPRNLCRTDGLRGGAAFPGAFQVPPHAAPPGPTQRWGQGQSITQASAQWGTFTELMEYKCQRVCELKRPPPPSSMGHTSESWFSEDTRVYWPNPQNESKSEAEMVATLMCVTSDQEISLNRVHSPRLGASSVWGIILSLGIWGATWKIRGVRSWFACKTACVRALWEAGAGGRQAVPAFVETLLNVRYCVRHVSWICTNQHDKVATVFAAKAAENLRNSHVAGFCEWSGWTDGCLADGVMMDD